MGRGQGGGVERGTGEERGMDGVGVGLEGGKGEGRVEGGVEGKMGEGW